MRKTTRIQNKDFGPLKISINDLGKGAILYINLKRYKKKRRINTWTLYESILEGHKKYAHIWADFQGKKLIGVEIAWDK
jgi:hypothetical protein